MPEPVCAACRGYREIITPEGPAPCRECEEACALEDAANDYYESQAHDGPAYYGFLAGARWQQQRQEKQWAAELAVWKKVLGGSEYADERDQE